jgi:hypothetical protein
VDEIVEAFAGLRAMRAEFRNVLSTSAETAETAARMSTEARA